MNLQKVIMNNFINVAGKKTMTEYSVLTGIERTRFFRLFHGVEMKVNELETLQKVTNQILGEEEIPFLGAQERQDLNNLVEKTVFKDLSIEAERRKRLRTYLKSIA